MTQLPMQWNTVAASGSQWAQTFTMLDDTTRHPLDLTGLTWEFVIRPNVTDLTSPALVQVTTATTAQGYITVDLTAAAVQVVLAAAATTLLGGGARPYSLWSNPGQAAATLWVEGIFNTQLTATA